MITILPYVLRTGKEVKIISFANTSPKRHDVFKKEMGVSFQGICETRWIERPKGHLQFQGESIINIHNALQEISTWQDRKKSSDAFSLMKAIRSPKFLLSGPALGADNLDICPERHFGCECDKILIC